MEFDQIAGLLPSVFQRTLEDRGPLYALLHVMAELQAPAEEALRGVDRTVDPLRAPLPFVDLMMRWVGLGYLAPSDAAGVDGSDLHRPPRVSPDRMRLLIASAAEHSRRRGTRAGLLSFLRAATGIAELRVEEDSQRQFHFAVYVPAISASNHELLRLLLDAEKPAFSTYEIHSPKELAHPVPSTDP